LKLKNKVLIISSEMVPFAKTGGLADVAGALPLALSSLGWEVRTIVPKYRMVDEGKFNIKSCLPEDNSISVPIDKKVEKGSLAETVLPGSEVISYFLVHPGFYDREELYRDRERNGDYLDNDERFIFFARGALEALKALGWRPQVIHCNDWQTGIIPPLLKTVYSQDDFFGGVATLFSVHNLGYQGNFPPSTLPKTGLNVDLFRPLGPLEYWNQVSFLKAGLVYADLVNTVSQRYAQEIQSDHEYGLGMEGVLKSRREDLYGIINGIDYRVWNPETDRLIPYRYSKDDLSGKEKDKFELLKKARLPLPSGRVPLIGIISRLADQKGFDLIAEVIDQIMSLDLQLVLLGTGDEKYHLLFKKIRRKYRQKAGISLTFDNQLAHIIEAGADIFLMPSRYEPCGLNQLYSLRYGTIPVVRETGGLADTIKDYEPRSGTGNGFVFRNYDSQEMLGAIKRALSLFQDRISWEKLMIRAMEENFSWEKSAQNYIHLYQKAIAKRGGD
jgi:starch synthase